MYRAQAYRRILRVVCKAPEWRTYSDVEALIAAFKGRGEPLFAEVPECQGLGASALHALAAALEVKPTDHDATEIDDQTIESEHISEAPGEGDVDAEAKQMLSADSSVAGSEPATSPDEEQPKLSNEEMVLAKAEMFAAAKRAEAKALEDAARAWEEDPRRWSDFSMEVQQGPETLSLGIRYVTWRDLVVRREVDRAVEEAASAPLTLSDDGTADPIAAKIAKVVAFASMPKASTGPILQRFKPQKAGASTAQQDSDDRKLAAVAALRALVLPKLSSANFALRGVFEAGAPDEERDAYLVPLLMSAQVRTFKGPRHCLLSEGDLAGAAMVLLEGGPLHVKRRDLLPDGTVADFIERTCSASGYKSEGDVEARSFVHGTNSIFADAGGASVVEGEGEGAGTGEENPLAAGSIAPSSLGDDATVTTTTPNQSGSSVIQDVVVKDGSDSTGIILGGDLLGSDYDNSRGKKYTRTVSLPASPHTPTTRVLVFGSAGVAWAVAARHEGSVGRFLKTAARVASHTGLTALKDESVEALAVACKRRELVLGERLVKQGDPCDTLYLLCRGELKLHSKGGEQGRNERSSDTLASSGLAMSSVPERINQHSQAAAAAAAAARRLTEPSIREVVQRYYVIGKECCLKLPCLDLGENGRAMNVDPPASSSSPPGAAAATSSGGLMTTKMKKPTLLAAAKRVNVGSLLGTKKVTTNDDDDNGSNFKGERRNNHSRAYTCTATALGPCLVLAVSRKRLTEMPALIQADLMKCLLAPPLRPTDVAGNKDRTASLEVELARKLSLQAAAEAAAEDEEEGQLGGSKRSVCGKGARSCPQPPSLLAQSKQKAALMAGPKELRYPSPSPFGSSVSRDSFEPNKPLEIPLLPHQVQPLSSARLLQSLPGSKKKKKKQLQPSSVPVEQAKETEVASVRKQEGRFILVQVALTPPLLSDSLKKDQPVCYFRVIGLVTSIAAASAHVQKLTKGQWCPSAEGKEAPSSQSSSSSASSWRSVQAPPPPPPVLPPIMVAEELSASSSNELESTTEEEKAAGAEAGAETGKTEEAPMESTTTTVDEEMGSAVTPSTPLQPAPLNTEPNTPMTPMTPAAAGEASSWSSSSSSTSAAAFPTMPYASPLVRDTFVLFDQSNQGRPAYACSCDLGLLHDPSTRGAMQLPPASVLAAFGIHRASQPVLEFDLLARPIVNRKLAPPSTKAVEYLGADPHALAKVLGPAALTIAPSMNNGNNHSSMGKKHQYPLPLRWGVDDSHHIRAPLGHWRSCEREFPGGGGVGDRGVEGEDMLHVGALMATVKMAGKVKRHRAAKKSQQQSSRNFADFLGSLGSGPSLTGEEEEASMRSGEEEREGEGEEGEMAAQTKAAWNFVAQEKEAQRALLLKRHHTIATERLNATSTTTSTSKQLHQSQGLRESFASSTSSRSSVQELGSSFDNRPRNRDLHDESAEKAEVAMEQTRQRGAVGRAMVEARAEAARMANGEGSADPTERLIDLFESIRAVELPHLSSHNQPPNSGSRNGGGRTSRPTSSSAAEAESFSGTIGQSLVRKPFHKQSQML